MPKVIVLGGCGAVGSVAVRTLAAHDAFDRVVIADIDEERAQALRQDIGTEGVSAARVDAGDAGSVRRVVEGCDVVLNCTGPFYKYVKTTLRAVMEAGVNYVDVCDDVDVTLELLEMDEAVRRAGICALIGMGNSPGVTNLLARFAADNLLDETESVDIYHAHGGEPVEGPGVIAHRFHCMSIDVPMYLEGELKTVRFFEPDGIALREKTDFFKLGRDIQVYPYPHPEQLTLPGYIKLKRVTNRGTVLPDEYYRLTMEMARLGLTGKDQVEVHGAEIPLHDFAVAFLIQRRDEILKETGFGSQRGCTKVVVSGVRHGKPRKYVFSMASTDQALGEGTGIPAAMGAILMLEGKVGENKGVYPPEGCINPLEFMALVSPVLELSQKGKSFEGFLVEKIDHEGNVEKVDLPI